jgi:hypothetical protein
MTDSNRDRNRDRDRELNFEVTIKTDGNISVDKVYNGLNNFVNRLTRASGIRAVSLDRDVTSEPSMTEDERERLVSALNGISDKNKNHAMKIARELKKKTESDE